jgi:hypothetical protein
VHVVTTETSLPSPEHDDTWNALVAEASRLTDQHCQGADVEVLPARRREQRTVQDGLWAGNEWVDVFQAVRERPASGGNWTDVQPVVDAAAAIVRFLRERPDRAAR